MAKRLLSDFNHFVMRPINVVIVLLLMIGFALYRQNINIQLTNHLVERQREALCLLVVHAEESPHVVITQEIREFCGDIFRVVPLEL